MLRRKSLFVLDEIWRLISAVCRRCSRNYDLYRKKDNTTQQKLLKMSLIKANRLAGFSECRFNALEIVKSCALNSELKFCIDLTTIKQWVMCAGAHPGGSQQEAGGADQAVPGVEGSQSWQRFDWVLRHHQWHPLGGTHPPCQCIYKSMATDEEGNTVSHSHV